MYKISNELQYIILDAFTTASISYYLFSVVLFDDVAAPLATEQVLTCTLSGLYQDTSVSWIGPDESEILVSDTTRYVIDQGIYVFGSKASTLTIKQSVISTLSVTSEYKCKIKSARYPTHSPDVIKQMTLTLLQLGNF